MTIKRPFPGMMLVFSLVSILLLWMADLTAHARPENDIQLNPIKKSIYTGEHVRQQADSDSDFEQVEQGFHEERGQFSRENEGARVFRPLVSQPRGVLRIGPFGIGLGF